MGRQKSAHGRASKQTTRKLRKDVRFPLMSVDEIKDDMRLFGYTMETSVIQNPRTSDVTDLYYFFLRELYGDDIERELQANADTVAVANHEYPELYPTPVLIRMRFIKAVRTMLNEACNGDFRLQDLEEPDGERLRHQLSALVNYAKFRRSRQVSLDVLANCEDETTAKHAQLKVELQKLREQIQRIEQRRAEEQPQVEQHQRIAQELIEQYKALDEKRVELTKNTGERKLELNELKERVANLEKKQIETRGEVAANKRLIVESPERAIKEIGDLSEELRLARDDFKKARDDRNCTDIRRKALSGALEALRGCAMQAEKIAQKRQEVSVVRQRLANSEARHRRVGDVMREAETEIKRHERAINAIVARRDRLSQVMEEHSKKVELDERDWMVQAGEVREIESECKKQGAELERRMSEIVDDVDKLMRKALSDMDIMVEKQMRLRNSCKLRNEQIRLAMGLFVEDSRQAMDQLSELDIE